MADSTSDADKIRAKRLAKLGSSSSSADQKQQAVPDEQNSDGENSRKQQTKGSSISSLSQATAAKIRPSPSEASNSGRSTSSAGIIQPGEGVKKPAINIVTRQQKSSSQPESYISQNLEDWQDQTLRNIFRVTLDGRIKQDAQGHVVRFLPDLRNELEESKQNLLLHISLLDQALLEAASQLVHGPSPLSYLLGCWKRVCKQMKALRRGGDEDPKYGIVKEARRLCMSYCIFAITMPDMFSWECSESSPLTDHLLKSSDSESGIDHDFLSEAIARFEEDESVQEALVTSVEDLSKRLSKKTMNDDYEPFVTALRILCQYPAIVSAISQSSIFIPETPTAGTFEVESLLGPFFALSPLRAEVTGNYFSAPQSRDRAYILNSQRALRMSLQTHQNELLDIANRFIKTNAISRSRLLDWFARCCNINKKRRAMQADKQRVSSDGFMINVTVCLDQLCEPFMDAKFSKIDRIDVEYLRRSPRIDIREETKLNADQKQSESFYNSPSSGSNNFISEIFFLTLAAHHYGLEAANSVMSEVDRHIKRMKRQLEELEADRAKYAQNPFQLRQFDTTVARWKDQIDKGISYKYATEGVLLDELIQGRSMHFMRYVIVWLLRLVSPRHDYPTHPVELPLPEEQPENFRCLPEYFLEDVVSNFKFIVRNVPQVMTRSQSDELVTLCITFLRSSAYIKNPYLKSGLVTILFCGTWPVHNQSKGILGDLLNALPIANQHLLHSLIKFYIEVENTGAHTQFYDKFNIRFEIFQIIKCIWSNTIYRDRLREEAAENVDFFVRFVNLLLNDVTFVLDESLSAFVTIHNLSQELKADTTGMEQSIRQEKEEALSAAKGKAKSYMQLTNETVAMLKLFTEALASSFTMPEIVQRLADMLDYNLDAMVGPKSRDLIVENPKDYGFEPKTLLSEIVDVYLNLRNKETFVFAVARDGRSYKPSNFEQATRILKKWGLKSPQDLAHWQSLGEKFKKAKEMDDQAEEDLGEIPDEFLDPLMFTLMTDPVILPTSRTTIDRSTIRSHLLSDPNDPFNRAPLTIDQVLPDKDLLARIEAFKQERKGGELQRAIADVMDESAG